MVEYANGASSRGHVMVLRQVGEVGGDRDLRVERGLAGPREPGPSGERPALPTGGKRDRAERGEAAVGIRLAGREQFSQLGIVRVGRGLFAAGESIGWGLDDARMVREGFIHFEPGQRGRGPPRSANERPRLACSIAAGVKTWPQATSRTCTSAPARSERIITKVSSRPSRVCQAFERLPSWA